MKNPLLLLVFMLALATAYAISQNPPAAAAPATQGASPATPETSPQNSAAPSPDPLAVAPATEVQDAIQNALRHEPGFNGDAIRVSVSEETIDLSGTVNSGKDKIMVHRLAESYAMNRRVHDQVTVATQATPGSTPATAGQAQSHLQKPPSATALNAMR